MNMQTPKIRTCGLSHPQVFEKQFLISNAAWIISALPQFHGCTAELIGFSPFRSNDSDDAAHALLLTSACGKKACIGLNFGAADRKSERRRPLNPDIWNLRDDLWYHAGIRFGSWDEVWAFICLLGERLCVSQVYLRYGI